MIVQEINVYINPNQLEPYSAPCTVVDGTQVDLAAADHVIREINSHVGWSSDDEEISQKLLAAPEFVFFAIKDAEIVGYALLQMRTYAVDADKEEHPHISWIAFTPQSRGQGLGSYLMVHIIARCQAEGYNLLTLHHRQSNEKLIKLYKNVALLANVGYEYVEMNGHYRVFYDLKAH